MRLVRSLSIVGGVFLLSGCVAAGPGPGLGANPSSNPAQGTASLTPSVANPGQPVTVSYTLDYRGNWSDLVAVDLAGLPTGDGAAVPLTLPAAAGVAQSVDLTLPIPTSAGSYPLTLRVGTARGVAATVPVGMLVVTQMPARLSDAAITPGLHSVGACSGTSLSVNLSYTIESSNGAAAVTEIRLLPTELASVLPVLPSTPIDLRHPPVLAPAPALASVGSFPVRPLMAVPAVPRQVASIGPAPSAGATLLPSQRWDVARDRVTTPIEIPCAVPAPTAWRLPIVGVVNGAQPTNTVAADYRVMP